MSIALPVYSRASMTIFFINTLLYYKVLVYLQKEVIVAPETIGSINVFAEREKIEPTEALEVYSAALSSLRRQLADRLGTSVDELHNNAK